jgi:hypothetical protein
MAAVFIGCGPAAPTTRRYVAELTNGAAYLAWTRTDKVGLDHSEHRVSPLHHVCVEPMRIVGLLFICVVAGCASTTPTPPSSAGVADSGLSAAPSTNVFRLPTVTAPPNFGGCVGVDLGIPLILDGSPTIEPHAYAVDPGGNELPITWPPGYGARFDPDLEVVTADGSVVARKGDEITSPTLAWPNLTPCIGRGGVTVYQSSDAIPSG